MSAVYFLTYIILFGSITKLVLNLNPPKWAVFLLIITFFVGWFIVIGLAQLHEEGRHKTGALLSSGSKEGLKLFIGWLAYMIGLALVSGVIFLLFAYPQI